MDNWNFLVITLSFYTVVSGDVSLDEEGDVIEEGLYKKSDNVVILTANNFNEKLFGQTHSQLVQFYNRYCGVCRNFRASYKKLAQSIKHWNKILRVAAIDCSVEENNKICRGHEVGFPTIRYFHENYVESATFGVQLSDKIHYQTVEEFKSTLASILQADQKEGYLAFAPDMQIYSYSSYEEAIEGTPKTVLYTILVFEGQNSSIGAELALDMNDYNHIKVKRVYDNSHLAKKAGLSNFPALVAVTPSSKSKVIKVKRNATEKSFLKCVNKFLHSKKYQVPIREKIEDEPLPDNSTCPVHVDTVFYNDLEKTIRYSLHVEVIRRQIMDGERLQALLIFLEVLITNFPFRNVGNLKTYLTQLLNNLRSQSEWKTDDVYDMVLRFEADNTPVYIDMADFVACKGSTKFFRGQTCGLWLLFHTLTVNALDQPPTEGPKILRAMHGYLKHFLMCGACSRGFQNKAELYKLFDVPDNVEAVLWLWNVHNRVNLKLSGTRTEDPVYPKIQFPSAERCPECWDSKKEWIIPAVYRYLKYMYSKQYIKEMPRYSYDEQTAENPLYSLNGMLQYL